MIRYEEEYVEIVVYRPPETSPSPPPRGPWLDQTTALVILICGAPVVFIGYIALAWWLHGVGRAVLLAFWVPACIAFVLFTNWLGKHYVGPFGARMTERIVKFFEKLNK